MGNVNSLQVGLARLHYAILTKDDETGVTYEAPVWISPAVNAKISPKTNSEVFYGDNGPDETLTSLGEIDVEIEAKDLPLSIQAAILGHTLAGGVLVKKSTDVAPYVALGFESLKSNGHKRYMWLTKGRFTTPEQDYATSEDKPKPQTPKIKGSFIKRSHDDTWQKIADEDDPDYVASIGANWFTVVEGAAPNALSVTLSPLDGATNVAVDSNLTWTFNNTIAASSMTPGNFMLIKASDGTLVDGALSIDTDRKVVTFNPASDLAASASYIMVASQGVKDIYGQSLSVTSIGNFTTV